MERPNIPPWSRERQILDIANNIFTVVFTIEMALKVHDMHFSIHVMQKHAFLRAKRLKCGRDVWFLCTWFVKEQGLLEAFFALELLFYMQLFIAEILKDFSAHTCGKK